jgi:glycosyltransferase
VISIITVSLNSADVLNDCIDSIRKQQFDYEHVLVDGASTDGTLDVITQYPRHFSKVVSEPDSGLYAAMNKGIGLTTGEIIGILNADDMYADNNVLSKVGVIFKDPAVEVCYGDLEYVAENDPCSVVRSWKAGPFDRDRFFNGWMPPHPTLFLRKSVYEKYGLFREDFGTAADYEFMLRIFVKNNLNAHYIPKVLVRMRSGGASNRNLAARWRANRNDARAWRVNGLKPRPWTTIAKPLRKIRQWRV